MAEVQELIDRAFEKLAAMQGFVERENQKQLALLISDCIGGEASGAFEAPTGLGKSLASLIPAIAHAIVNGKRTVIATYTNVLAEQYWRKDLPLALSLFDSPLPKAQFLIGRQRYACQAAMAELPQTTLRPFKQAASLGIETEFRQHVPKQGRELSKLWTQVTAPPVCPGKLCNHYQDCYYYSARRSAELAKIVITNHSVVLSDALLGRSSEGEQSMLGDYDFLVLDEAHDFPQAATNSLEFELSDGKLNVLAALANRIQTAVYPLAFEAGEAPEWLELCETFKAKVKKNQERLANFQQSGILRATPAQVNQHPQVTRNACSDPHGAQVLAGEIGLLALEFSTGISTIIRKWRDNRYIEGERADEALSAVRNYSLYLTEFGSGCHALFAGSEEHPDAVGVTYASGGYGRSPVIRYDTIDLVEPLQELVWTKRPYACLSATLAVDGSFDFFKRITGAEPEFEEVLPTPFDFPSQTAIYLPSSQLPDPTEARKLGKEEQYFQAVAHELGRIIQAAEGRTLALFHSRREMEEVHMRMDLPPDLPVFIQRASGAASTGDRFKSETRSSLFALRSFWTGFDAPGETCSCVVLVRVPFEVPVDPPQIARMAWLESRGLPPFMAHTLPNAKMLMRQGAGRLIRRSEDVGVIALLDSRLRTKRYGEEILDNLPAGMRRFHDIEEALGHVGLGPSLAVSAQA